MSPIMLFGLLGLGGAALYSASSKKTASTGVPASSPTIRPLAPQATVSPTLVAPPPAAQSKPAQAQDFKARIAKVLRALGVDPVTGKIVGVPPTEAVQAATLLATQMEAAGFADAARTLRQWAALAVQQKEQLAPSPPQVTTPKIPEWLKARVDKAIKYERDPKVLQALAAELRKLPAAGDPEVQMLIGLLEQTASQSAAAVANAQTAQAIQAIMTTQPSAAPTPAPPPQAKSELEMAAEAVARELKRVQGSGSSAAVKAGKGRENKTLVKTFQALASQTADGKAGPGTLLALARAGVCVLPLVMYWPRGANAKRVLQYRSQLRQLAGTRAAPCSNELLASATRERGQAGIVGAMPK